MQAGFKGVHITE